LPAIEAEQQRPGGRTADVEGQDAIHVSVVACREKRGRTPGRNCPPYN
jgi:hypothetical protein